MGKVTGFCHKNWNQREFPEYCKFIKISKKNRTMHHDQNALYHSLFFSKIDPPSGHTQKSDLSGKTSAYFSSLGVELTDRRKSAQISKAVLPKPDPQFGHFTLTPLIYVYLQLQGPGRRLGTPNGAFKIGPKAYH